jgi:hypothetical protein
MVSIPSIQKGDEETCVRNALHFLANPFRCDKSGAPSIEPAKAMKALDSGFRDCSKASLTSALRERPVFRERSSNLRLVSSGKRMEIV